MKYEYYKDIEIGKDYKTFEFISIGIKGNIPKWVVFSFIEEMNVYNLAFGDVGIDGSIDDYSISNNNDMTKVLATLAATVQLFFEKHPESKIFFRGSTAERTRLYRMAIGINLTELSVDYIINGILEDGSLDDFQQNQRYEAFVIEKKFKFEL